MNLPYAMRLLGGLRVVLGSDEATSPVVTRFRTQKTAALLAYLACHQEREHRREELIDRFWPDADFETARISLRTSLASLRRQIEPPGIATNAVLIANRLAIRLDPRAILTDVSRFESAVAAGRRAASPAERLSALQAALDLYNGPLLPGFYDDWALVRREHLSELHRQAVRQVVADRARAGAMPAALAAARRATEADPQDNTLRELLARLLASADKSEGDDFARLAEENQAVTDSVPTPLPMKAPSGNLPLRMDRFFGRIGEREQLRQWLADTDTRVITLTGAGGMGKTRLAIETAAAMREQWPQGVWFVPLRETQTAAGFAIAVRDALHLPAQDSADPILQVIAALTADSNTADSTETALFVLDNFEQLDADATSLVLQLLRALPGLKCLVTSRRRLAIAGERPIAVEPLQIPTVDADAMPQALADVESVQLFTDRAQASRPDFQITDRNASAVARLCADLEGIPLAIELAAAWSQVLTPGQMRERLAVRFDLMAPRPQEAARLGGQRSLQVAIAWSYDLLAPELRSFLTRLSVFRGGWTAEAAGTIAADTDHALDFLAHLRERSLVRSEETAAGAFRFGMFESIREFAALQLSPDSQQRVSEAHAAFFTTLAETAEPNLRGHGGSALLRTLDDEYPNFQAALEHHFATADAPIPGLRLASALGWYWDLRGRWAEGRSYLSRALDLAERSAAPDDAQSSAYASAAFATGRLAYQQSDTTGAEDAYQKALAIRRREGGNAEIGKLLLGLAGVAFHAGDMARARALTEENLALRREIDDRIGIAAALDGLSSIALEQEDYPQARAYAAEGLTLMEACGNDNGAAHLIYNLGMIANKMHTGGEEASTWYERGLALHRKLDNPQGICHGLCCLGTVALQTGEYPRAQQLFEEALVTARKIGDLWTETIIHSNLGRIAFEQGRLDAANESARESLRRSRKISDTIWTAKALSALALYAQAEGAHERAVFLWGASHTIHENLNRPVEERLRAEQTSRQAEARSALGDRQFTAAWARGVAADLETVVQMASGESV